MPIIIYSKNYDGTFIDASQEQGVLSTYHNVVTYPTKYNYGYLKGDGQEYSDIRISFKGKTYRLQYTIDDIQQYIDFDRVDGIDSSSIVQIDDELMLINSINSLTKRAIVTRGYNNTIPKSHSSSSLITVSTENTKFVKDSGFYSSLSLFLDPIEISQDIDETITLFQIKDPYDCNINSIFSDGQEKIRIIKKEHLIDDIYNVEVERISPQPHLKGEKFYLYLLNDDKYHQFTYYTQPVKGSNTGERNDIILELSYTDNNLKQITKEYDIKTYTRLAIIGTIGDSITAGHAAFRAEDHKGTYCCNGISYDNDNTNEDVTSQYQYWLSYRLGKNYKVYNYGTGEEVGYQVKNRFSREILSLHPDYTIIQCGTNDLSLFSGANVVSGISPDSTMDQWIFSETPIVLEKNNSKVTYYGLVPAVKEMIKMALDNNIQVIIGNLLPRNGLTSDMKKAFDAFNNWIKEYVSGLNQVYMVDFFNASNEGEFLREDPNDENNYNMNGFYSSGVELNEDGSIKKSGDGIHLNSNGYKIMGYCMNIDILFDASVEGFDVYLTPDFTYPPVEGELDILNNIYVYPIAYNLMQLGRQKVLTRYIYNKGINNELLYIQILNHDGANVSLIYEDKEVSEISSILAADSFFPLTIQITPTSFNSNIQLIITGRPLEVV